MSWKKWWGDLFQKKTKKPKQKKATAAKRNEITEFPTTSKICRELEFLHPALRPGIKAALEECHREGLMVHVFEGYRTLERQQELFDQGRNSPGRKVTNARPYQSFHNYGLAFDLVFDGDDRDGIQWSWEGDYNTKVVEGDKRSDYQRTGEILEKYGFEWGARWKSFKEMPHFQMVFGLRYSELQTTCETEGMQAVWDLVAKRRLENLG